MLGRFYGFAVGINTAQQLMSHSNMAAAVSVDQGFCVVMKKFYPSNLDFCFHNLSVYQMF